MWNSFQIYETSNQQFFKALKYLIENRNIDKNDFFYTLYFDAYGSHIRFRFYENHELYNFILMTSGNKKKTVYDKDIVKYGKYNSMYEQFSCITSNYIVLNIFLEETKRKLEYIIGIIDLLSSEYDLDCQSFFRKYIMFWNRTAKYFKSNFSNEEMLDVNFSKYDENHFLEIREVINSCGNIGESEKEKICFHLIHMTFNRLSLNLKDETQVIHFLLAKGEDVK